MLAGSLLAWGLRISVVWYFYQWRIVVKSAYSQEHLRIMTARLSVHTCLSSISGISSLFHLHLVEYVLVSLSLHAKSYWLAHSPLPALDLARTCAMSSKENPADRTLFGRSLLEQFFCFRLELLLAGLDPPSGKCCHPKASVLCQACMWTNVDIWIFTSNYVWICRLVCF